MNAAEIAAGLQQARRIGVGKYVACCPAHDDSSPSFAITDKGDRTLIYCRSGCTQSDVISALENMGLWTQESRRASNRPAYYSRDELLGMHCFVEVCKAGFIRGERLSAAGYNDYKRYLTALKSKGYSV